MSEGDGRHEKEGSRSGEASNPLPEGHLDRRSFRPRSGASALAVGALGVAGCEREIVGDDAATSTRGGEVQGVRRYVRLPRSEMKPADISMGSGAVDRPDTLRHAYDLGINYFGTAEIHDSASAARARAQ